MLPIKKAHINHYYDLQIKWAKNTDVDLPLLAILYGNRVRFTGTHFIPIAAIAGDRAIQHWLLIDEHNFATYLSKDRRRHGLRTTTGPLTEMIDRLPEKDANGAIVKKYMVQQINKEVAYGKFPFRRKDAAPIPPILGTENPDTATFDRTITNAHRRLRQMMEQNAAPVVMREEMRAAFPDATFPEPPEATTVVVNVTNPEVDEDDPGTP